MADLELRHLMREVKNAQMAVARVNGSDEQVRQGDSARRAAESRLGAALAALQVYERRMQTWPPNRGGD
jgi:hypothetical protein